MSASAPRVLALAAAACLVLAGCTPSGSGNEEATPTPTPTPTPEPERGALHLPDEPVTVLPGEGGELALAASRTFFAEAPVAVLADDSSRAHQLRAAGIALALGAPVLLDDDAGAVAEELDRLGTGWLVTVGEVSVPGDTEADVVVVPAPEGDELAQALSVPLTDPVPVDEGQGPAAVAGLERGVYTPLVPAGDEDSAEGDEGEAEPTSTTEQGAGAAGAATSPSPGDTPEPVRWAIPGLEDPPAPYPAASTGPDPGSGELPRIELPDPAAPALALSTGTPDELLASATVRAAGAELVLVPGGDPRATSETVSAVAEAGAEHVIGLGDGFTDAETLGWQVATAATGTELPGGGQLVFPDKRYVALYGSPSTSLLGVLGEQGVEETIERAAEHAAPYEELTEDTVVPALEIIVTVASAGAGDDGNYSRVTPVDELRPLVDAAGEAGQYVVLDLQPGRASFLEQAQLYAELLAEPHVGLALDPEWNLGPDEVHLRQIGSTTAAEVNEVVHWLADFTREHALPQKMLVLHQFQVRMIQTVPEVDLSRSELEVLIHVDGQGSQPAKQETWRTLLRHGPDIEWWGWKNFYDEDSPMLTPEETAEVEPFPHFISYQ